MWAKTDVLMTHDVCGPGTIGIFKKEFGATAKVCVDWIKLPYSRVALYSCAAHSHSLKSWLLIDGI